MSDAADRYMTADEFLVWRVDLVGRWELIAGRPVQKREGWRARDDCVAVNLLCSLRSRRSARDVHTAGYAVAIDRLTVRQPDLHLSDPRQDGEYASIAPVAAFEVWSPHSRTGEGDWLLDYQRAATMQHVVLVSSVQACARVWVRGQDAWCEDHRVEGLESSLNLSAIGLALPMAEIYEDVELSETAQLE